jgi:hypothetical protein
MSVVLLLIWQLLPSNSSTCHTTPSLQLFVPNGLQAYCHFFIFSEGCDCDIWLASPSFPMTLFPWWLFCNCSCCSLLKAAHPEQFPDRVPTCPGVPPSSFFSKGCEQEFCKWSVLLLLWLISCVHPSFICAVAAEHIQLWFCTPIVSTVHSSLHGIFCYSRPSCKALKRLTRSIFKPSFDSARLFFY